jgi:cytochrome c-type biogenesis protein CcmF
MFLNQRTQQLMVNPDIRKSLSADLYISPIQYDPGQPKLALGKGQQGEVGDVRVKFEGFDLNANGNALAQMASGKEITIGTIFAVTRNGQTTQARPVYKLNPANGQVETPAFDLPGGGAMRVSKINASSGNVEIELAGVDNRAILAVDVTTKPLIEMVWFGLYLMLGGGGLAMALRFRDARVLERVAEQRAAA